MHTFFNKIQGLFSKLTLSSSYWVMDVTFKLNSGPRKLLNIIQHGIEVRATQELNTASHCFEILTIMNIKMGILWC